MAGWLSRATEAFRTPPPPAPEPYEVGCDCGGRVRGERSRLAQRPPCPSCGRLVFVLPSNVYPRPIKSITKKVAAKVAKPTATKLPPSSVPNSNAVQESPKAASREARSGIALEAREKRLTPFRIAVVAMVTLTCLTAWGLWSRHRLETARSTVARATEAGMLALKEGNFDVAARELEQARDAITLLGLTDEDSQRVRCLCREAIAARGLTHDSLFTLLHTSLDDIRTAANDRKPGDKRQPDEVKATRFDNVYRGSWVLLDAVVLVPEDDTLPCSLDMPIFHLGQPVRVEVNFAALRAAARQSPPNEPVRVIFAAQLERLTPAAGPQSPAVLTLKEESALLWTSHESLSALGFYEIDDEDRRQMLAILDRQLGMMREVK